MARYLLLEDGSKLYLESLDGFVLLEGIDLTAESVVSTTSVLVPNLTFGVATITVPDIISAASAVSPAVTLSAVTAPVDNVLVAASIISPTVTVSGAAEVAAPIIAVASSIISPLLDPALELSVPVISVSSAVIAPTVTNQTILSAEIADAILTVLAPSMTFGAKTLTADVITVATSVFGVLVTGIVFNADSIISNATVLPPFIAFGGLSFTADVLAVTTTVISPTVVNPTNLTSPVCQVITQIIPPILSVGAATITVPTVTANTSVIIATVSANLTIVVSGTVEAATTVIPPTISAVSSPDIPVITVITEVIPPIVGIGSEVFQYNPAGRKQIVVDQQQGGTNYPFVSPSDNLDNLIGDLYLGYSDDTYEFVQPFNLRWLHGFGTTSTSPITSTHSHDVLVEDANGEVIFDTTTATSFKITNWENADGVYLNILEWVNTTTRKILRIVKYAAWSDIDSAQSWPLYFEPSNSILDTRTIEKFAPKVETLAVATTLSGSATDVASSGQKLIFAGGYNAAFTRMTDEELSANADGSERVSIIKCELAPGLGLGQYPCEAEVVLRRIGNVTADENGNVSLDAPDCYKVSRPITVNPENTSEADVALATIKISNDCGPCCDCQDFINVYEAIRRGINEYKDLSFRLAAVIDQLRANKERWETAIRCKSDSNVQAVAEAFAGCKLAAGVGVCNTSDAPMKDVNLKISFAYGPDADNISAESTISGCIMCGTTVRRGNTSIGSGIRGRAESYEISGSWPDYTIHFDCINPGTLATVNWVMKFDNCSDTDVIEFVVLGGKTIKKVQTTLFSESSETCCDSGPPNNGG